MKKLALVIAAAGMFMSGAAFSQSFPGAEWTPVGTMVLRPDQLSSLIPGPSPGTPMFTYPGSKAPTDGPGHLVGLSSFSAAGLSGSYGSLVSTSAFFNGALLWGAQATNGLLWIYHGPFGTAKEAYLGYSYDGQKYIFYISVNDASSGTSQVTNYAFTVDNLGSDLAAVPQINAYFSGGWAGQAVLAAPYQAPALDWATNSSNPNSQTVINGGVATVTSTHNGLAEAQAGRTDAHGDGPMFVFKIKSANTRQDAEITFAHTFSGGNKWHFLVGVSE